MTRSYQMINRLPKQKCKICEKPVRGHGYCSRHYQNFKYSGNPLPSRKYRNELVDLLKIIEEIPLNEHGCKIWPNARNNYGYGIFNMSDKSYIVHRTLYLHTYPEDYTGILIRHKCDVRSCCNIDHLESGTARDNAYDKIKRGRQAIGINSGTAKLNDEKVKEIKLMHPTYSYDFLAKKYGVTKQAIAHIIKGRSWKHVSIIAT